MQFPGTRGPKGVPPRHRAYGARRDEGSRLNLWWEDAAAISQWALWPDLVLAALAGPAVLLKSTSCPDPTIYATKPCRVPLRPRTIQSIRYPAVATRPTAMSGIAGTLARWSGTNAAITTSYELAAHATNATPTLVIDPAHRVPQNEYPTHQSG